jgi:FKBP-type peptidyl-prolyl cis-trans isomerase
MRYLKVISSFLLIFILFSCVEDELGIEQYYENRDEGIAFLEKNKNIDGVITTVSGLQYEIIERGEGLSTLEKDIVKAKYKYTLIDGTVVFDSKNLSDEDIEYIQVDRFISGIKEGIQLMNQGSKYIFYIPFELGYNDLKVGNIDPFSTIILEIELIRIGNDGTDFLNQNKVADGVVETESGLQYKILSVAENATFPSEFSTVKVNYSGKLIDGTVFDTTSNFVDDVEIKTPINLYLGNLISGFSEAVLEMNEGDVYEVYIPFNLGYGGQNDILDIPPFSVLIFEIELVEVLN